MNISAAQTRQPNVILIYADDISAREFPIYQSSVWSGLRGNTVADPDKRAKTPVIDRLAKDGVYFDTAWATTVCSPSRAMMMTGRYANIHKWWTNGDIGYLVEDGKRKRNVRLYETSPFQIGHLAKQAGYRSIWAGKTQMKGGKHDHSVYGFDEGVFTPGLNYPNPGPYSDFNVIKKGQRLYNQNTGEPIKKSYVQQGWYWKPNVQLMNHSSAPAKMQWWPNTEAAKKSYGVHTYGPDVELDFIFDFIERQQRNKQPFFVYHTTHLGHDAFDFLNPASKDKWPATPKVVWDGSGYTRITPRITKTSSGFDTHNTLTDSGIDHHIEYLDYQVWLYLKKLKTLGISDNTIIIITADNGTSGYGKHQHVQQRGTHVPFIIYAPGQVLTKQGQQKTLVSIADVMPTLADIFATKIPADYTIHGQSVWPYLTTDTVKHRDYLYSYKGPRQLIRGHYVMKDGNDDWWDVSQTPADLTSFKKITNWQQVSAAHRQERKMLESVLPTFNNYDEAHDYVLK
ncbi:sulfatase-like hydrolase/transferase [Gayadomonas joobiniege]|uniref:sulfatase-like hydrolase/transferase n=1 Tax=Gayadomonas joobiniege TaxID=1234606 RepID=UPI00037AC214|nr:sulfatase-like hydrolase/transferase [Gayadomonas joobiniege]